MTDMNTQNTSPRTLLFARVSSTDERQNTDRQVNQLKEVAEQRGWNVIDTITFNESASRKSQESREAFKALESWIQSGKIDKIIVHEISRIGRDVGHNDKILKLSIKHSVSIFALTQGIETLDHKGEINGTAKFMFQLMSALAEQETDRLSKRIKSGLKEAKRKGTKLGRPSGKAISDQELIKKHSSVAKHLKNGQSIRNTAKICGIAKSTVQRIKKAMEATSAKL